MHKAIKRPNRTKEEAPKQLGPHNGGSTKTPEGDHEKKAKWKERKTRRKEATGKVKD